MKFLIIGASGMVGQAASAALQAVGHTVVGTASKAKNSSLIPFDLSTDSIPAKIDSLLSLLKPTLNETIVVVIFAFVAQIDACFAEKERSHLINVIKMQELLDYLQTKNVPTPKVKIIFISSSFVFDGTKGYYNESDAKNPICEYGRHKAEVEEYIEKHLPTALILRLDKVVSAGGGQNNLFSQWHSSLAQGKEITCMKGQLFSPTYAGDVARGLVLAGEQNLCGTFHFANQEFFTREELARQFVEYAADADYAEHETKIISKSQEELGFADLRPLKTHLDSSMFVAATGMRFTPMRRVLEIFFQNKTRKRQLKIKNVRD